MIGLLFLATVAVWLWLCAWVAQKSGDSIKNRGWRVAAKLMIFLAAASLPLVDEAIGQMQFANLCRLNGIESVSISRARGKKVKVEYGARKLLKGTIVPIKESDVIFRSVDNGEPVIRHKNYYAQGGWVMRYTWIGMGSSEPMLFGGSGCDVRREQKIFQANDIVFVYE